MVDYAKVVAHMAECENELSNIDGTITPNQKNTFGDLTKKTSKLIQEISDDREFVIPPAFPFSKSDILKKLEECEKNLNQANLRPTLQYR